MYQSSALSHDGAQSRFPAPRKLLRAFAPALLSLSLICCFCGILDAQTRVKKRSLTLDIVTTPVMVFVPIQSNLPNYLINIRGKSQLVGLQVESVRERQSLGNTEVKRAFFSFGFSFRSVGLNWRKDPLNHAEADDVKALDALYSNVFMGGKFFFTDRLALNLNVGPGALIGPALQNDNIKSGVFTTFGVDASITISYNPWPKK
jgi:hypothetical protein